LLNDNQILFCKQLYEKFETNFKNFGKDFNAKTVFLNTIEIYKKVFKIISKLLVIMERGYECDEAKSLFLLKNQPIEKK
jgi:hypothetical protein